MELTTEQKIKRYHAEEVMLILFIGATDLSDYRDQELEVFAEAIEGRVEVLFEPEYLLELGDFLKVHDKIIPDFMALATLFKKIYAGLWRYKMRDYVYWEPVNRISGKILKALHLDYVEPNLFMNDNLNIDWTDKFIGWFCYIIIWTRYVPLF